MKTYARNLYYNNYKPLSNEILIPKGEWFEVIEERTSRRPSGMCRVAIAEVNGFRIVEKVNNLEMIQVFEK